MKSQIFAALLLSASVASACPNLSGTYACTEDDGTVSNMTITQLDENGTTTYSVGDDKSTELEMIIADGVARSTVEKIVEDGETETVYTTSTWTCDDAALKGVLAIRDEMASGTYLIDADFSANLTEANDFQTVITGAVKDVNGNVLQNINQVSVCARTTTQSQH